MPNLTTATRPRTSEKPLTPETIQAVEAGKAYIGEHYADRDLSLPHIAAAARLSVFYFCHVFKRHTGKRPMRYVAELRIASAKIMLLLGGHTIPFVGKAMGYAHQSHFTMRFKQIVGLPPGRWLKAERKKRPQH